MNAEDFQVQASTADQTRPRQTLTLNLRPHRKLELRAAGLLTPLEHSEPQTVNSRLESPTSETRSPKWISAARMKGLG